MSWGYKAGSVAFLAPHDVDISAEARPQQALDDRGANQLLLRASRGGLCVAQLTLTVTYKYL